jgi:poly(A) polymerase
MLMGPRPYAAITILRHCRLLRQFLPEVDDLAGLPQPPEFHPEGDVFMHTLLTLERAVGESRTLTLMLACLLHDIGKKPTYEVTDRIRFNGHDKVGAEMAEAILRRLKYSNDVIETEVSHVANHMEFRHVQQMRLARLKRFLALPKFEELLALHRADCLASNGKLDNYEFIRQKQQELPPEVVKPPRLITGDDILALFPGSSPGPWIGEMLAAVEEGQLDGTIKARDEAVALVTDIRFCRFNPEVY